MKSNIGPSTSDNCTTVCAKCSRYRTITEPGGDGNDVTKQVEVLSPTDRVIVEGLQRVRPGAKVDPRLVDMLTMLRGEADRQDSPASRKEARRGRRTEVNGFELGGVRSRGGNEGFTMSRFFIDRPIFAWVLSIVIVISGLACVASLPIAQYPPIVPPTIQVTVSYPGASAKTVSDAVGQPIEAQVNGVEGMIYMSSTCTNNGQYTLTVSFEVGTDIHTALMLVQTRVQLAQPQLPESVQKQGVNVKMQSPNILLAVNMISPDGRYDPLYLSNYAQINIFDELSRVPGVGLVNFLGPAAVQHAGLARSAEARRRSTSRRAK